MKIRLSKEHGSVLMVALVIAGVVGLALLSYLSMTSSQNVMTARSQTWNSALPLVEAGIEEAMAHLTASPNDWGLHGWNGKTGFCYLRRDMGEGYYVITISNRTAPTIIAAGYVRAPFSTNYIARVVRVGLIMKPQIGPGLGAKSTIEMNGNKLSVDSFDSSDPLYSAADGGYASSKRKAGVVVATNLGITDAIDSGGADIFGHVATGPGGSVSTLKNGVVGDLAWHKTSSKGIEPGFTTEDADIPFPTIVAPVSGSSPPLDLLGNIVLGDGVYEIGSLTGNVIVTGKATLIVRTVFDIAGADAIHINTNGSLKIYNYAAKAVFGSGSYNYVGGGEAKYLRYFGMPGNTEITFKGNTSFVGVLYAPDADLITAGGGSGVNFCGASLTKSVSMNGSYAFHYDEELIKEAEDGYIIATWDEVSPTDAAGYQLVSW